MSLTMSWQDETYFTEILNSLTSQESEVLNKAYNFSKKSHHWQKRKSGEEYFIHPLSVWLSLWKKFHNLDLFVAGLLHDTVEDCKELKIETIYKEFGDNVWFIVDSISKWEKTFYREKEEFLDIKDKMIAGGIKNIGCILVKLADREHNLATLKHMPPDKQVKKSFESQSLYIPLMHILCFKEEKITIDKARKKFSNYLLENNLKHYKEIKVKLFNICFSDFSEELFELVYHNTTSVVWKLEDKILFQELLDSWWFNGNDVEVISIVWDLADYFKVRFKVKIGNKFLPLKKITISQNRLVS